MRAKHWLRVGTFTICGKRLTFSELGKRTNQIKLDQLAKTPEQVTCVMCRNGYQLIHKPT